MDRDYVKELLKLRGIDRDIFNQINDWFIIKRDRFEIKICLKYDYTVPIQTQHHIIYHLYKIVNNNNFISSCVEDNKKYDDDMKLWMSNNGCVVNNIIASEFVIREITKYYLPYENALSELPCWILENVVDIDIKYPIMTYLNKSLDLRHNYNVSGHNYECVTNTEFYDIRMDYIKKEHDRRGMMYDELEKYLIDNDIKYIFDIIVRQFMVEIDEDIVLVPVGKNIKCNIDGHNVEDILKYQYELGGKFNDGLDMFTLYDRNAIIVSHFINSKLAEIKMALVKDGPEICEVLFNNCGMDKELKQTFMGVSKYFNGTVKNMDVVFKKMCRVGCVEGCGNKILVMSESVMPCLPKCVECDGSGEKVHDHIENTYGHHITYNVWARCQECKCLFFLVVKGNKRWGKNLAICDICCVKW